MRQGRKEAMGAVAYGIISFVIMIVTMIFTKSSPSVFFDIVSSVVSGIFPFLDYVQMSTKEANVTLVYLGILSEWFINFINSFLDDEEQKVFVWGGNTFTVLTISMLSTAMVDEMADNLIGFLALLVVGYILIVVIYSFINRGISWAAFGLMLKMVYINPIVIGFFISLLRLALPAILMMVSILPLILIPIKVIQIIGIVIIVFLGYFFKQFSDKLVDKIDHDETAMLIRFIVAVIIIIAEIILLTGHALPKFN